MFSAFLIAFKRPSSWAYPALLAFKGTYRRSNLGIAWPVLATLGFVSVLGVLFGAVLQRDAAVFIPSLATGFAIWTFINSTMLAAGNFYISVRNTLLQGSINQANIVMGIVAKNAIEAGLQFLAVFVVLVYFGIVPTVQYLLIIPSVALLFIHAIWVLVVVGIVCARFHDLAQLVPICMRIGFLATPIIWLPNSERGDVLGPFMLLNPFYHALEPLRRALLGQSPDLTSYGISVVVAVCGLALAAFCYKRYSRQAILWI